MGLKGVYGVPMGSLWGLYGFQRAPMGSEGFYGVPMEPRSYSALQPP